MRETFCQIDFNQFKANLKEYSFSQFSSDYIDELQPYNSLEKIQIEQNRLSEAISVFDNFDGTLPDSKHYYPFFKKLMDPYASWLVNDFLTFAEFHRQLAEFKKSVFANYEINHLKELFSNVFVLPEVVEGIFSKISTDGNVKDTASDRLFEIRKEKRYIKDKLYENLNRVINGKDADKFVQERVIKEYNNRLVLLLKSNFKQYINGIVHSISGTGLTLYVEPSTIVDMNNRYQELVSLEELEINRILLKILDNIKSKSYEISETVKSMTKIYFYYTVFRYLNGRKYVFPVFGNRILAEGLHHPLIYDLKQHNSVPIDFSMDKDTMVAIITGPNAGGKTAALKSIGLNTLIAKSGLPLFANYVELINFEKVFADIGDQQSIVMDLSTFTSHMVNIKDIIDRTDNSSLVLLDELGTGTDPKEGEALAIAIIEFLKGKGSKVIVTTHFNGVRNLAYKSKDIILYGVDFDYENFEPKFRLIKGLAGRSDPLIIANKLNFDKNVLNRAKAILDEYKSQESLSFEEVNELRMELEREKSSLDELKKKLEEKERELSSRESELKRKLSAKEHELLSEALSILNRVKSLNTKSLSSEDLNKLKKDISEKLEKLDDSERLDDVKVGDLVRLSKYGKVAKVLDISKNKVYVDMEGMKLTLDMKNFKGEKIKEEPFSKEQKVSVSTKVEKSSRYEIVLIGKTVDDAWDELDRFIDKAIISGWDKIYVIHGRGSGALRKGLHNFLKNDRRVKSFRLADIKEGGDAITVVEV